MSKKNIGITVLITLIAGLILFLSNMTDKIFTPAYLKYQVYLGGEKIGVIDNEEELYNALTYVIA